MKNDVLPHGEQNNLPVNLHTPPLADDDAVIQPGRHTPHFHTFVSFKYSEEVYFFVNALILYASAFLPILPFLYPLFN